MYNYVDMNTIGGLSFSKEILELISSSRRYKITLILDYNINNNKPTFYYETYHRANWSVCKRKAGDTFEEAIETCNLLSEYM